MRCKTRAILAAVGLLGLVSTATPAAAGNDAYENYVKTSPDFKPVKQDKAWALQAYPNWVFMPWYYQWAIGHDDAAGEFCKTTGINGAFVDAGNAAILGWIDKFNLKFYMDHTANKGYLHLWDGGKDTPFQHLITGTGTRVKPVNDEMKATLKTIIARNVKNVKGSPNRAAYALDDEISWGHFVKPCMWNATDDEGAYERWLNEIYGGNAPEREKWIGYEQIRPNLATWDIASFDASPLMDQWTFNDSYWANFVGDLVEYTNSQDPATPCGFVGGQGPSPFGGYDYAKLMKKIQYLEAYNIGGSQAIIRSFNPQNALPAVTSYFHVSFDDGVWAMWYYLAQGNRGHIGWVENWFDDKTPKPWLVDMAPTFREIGGKISPLISGAEWQHDGVALYYSHASVQLSWIMDAQAHGKTWVKRGERGLLGSAGRNRQAWMNMLRDEGLQFNWLSYADVVKDGIPSQYKVLILPAVFCLSDVEAKRIAAFAEAGGTVIADYMPGLWDQHGKGRETGGALDKLFGVMHDPKMTARDVFNGTGSLWCEVNEDSNYDVKTPKEFFSKGNSCLTDPSGFHKAVRGMGVAKVSKVGKGTAALLNLSPQLYSRYRSEGKAEAGKRAIFTEPLHGAGLSRWVSLAPTPDGKEFGYEFTAWTKDQRVYLFLIANNEVTANSLGGGAAVALKTDSLPVTIRFAREVTHVRDERQGKELGNGKDFAATWTRNEAVVLSFDR